MEFCRDIDIAYMILPVIICLYYLLESVFVVAYLDTVYFGVTQWQETLYRLDLTTNISIILSFYILSLSGCGQLGTSRLQ